MVVIPGGGDCLSDQSSESQYETDALLFIESLPYGYRPLLLRWVENAQLLHGCPPLPAGGQYSRHSIAAAKRQRSSAHGAARHGKQGKRLERAAALQAARVVR